MKQLDYVLCEHKTLSVIEYEGMPNVLLDGVLVWGRGDFPAEFQCYVCESTVDMFELDDWWGALWNAMEATSF